MKKTKFGLGVFACVFNKDFSKVLLVKRNKEKRTKYGIEWGNLGGRVELGESSKEACIREAQEEAGLKLKEKDIVLLRVIETPNDPRFKEFHAIHFVYAASIPENTKITINHESDSYKWFSLEHLPESMLDEPKDILKYARLAKKEFGNP